MNNYYMPQPTWGNPTPLISQQYLPPTLPVQTKDMDGNNFVWIQGGKMAAQAYPVAPGHTVVLRDSENPVIYVKVTDDNGKPQPMQTFRKVEEEEIEEKTEFIRKEDLDAYVTKDDMEDIFKDLQGIKDTLLDMQTAPSEQSDNNTRRWK